MDQQEALNKINEIHSIMESSNRALFSGERMMVMGALISLIPLLEISTKGLTFGYEMNSVVVMIMHIVFYWGLFSLIGRFLPYKKKDSADLHPLIKKAFSLKFPFMVGIFGTMIAFAMVGKFELIHPVVFVLLGLMWCVFGRFSIPAVTYIAYSYIGLGLIYIYLSQMQIPYLWAYMVVYNGLSYFAMGLFLKKEQALV
ncbi:MAG: rane protein [Pseudobdellovibrio sp.]|nr:rane protein [Pseudobdellovibrio sp.]